MSWGPPSVEEERDFQGTLVKILYIIAAPFSVTKRERDPDPQPWGKMGSSAIMEEACNSSLLRWPMTMEGNFSLQREGEGCPTAGPCEKPKVRRDLKGEENQGDRRGRGWEAERQAAWGPVKMTNHV